MIELSGFVFETLREDEESCRKKGQSVGGLCVGVRVIFGWHRTFQRNGLGQPVPVDVQPVARTRGVRASER
jgi:hypothetical protein